MEFHKVEISEISKMVRNKEVSAVEVTQYFLDRIKRLNPQLNAYITINEAAIEQARLVDQKLANNEEVGSLAGVPVGVKDLLCTAGIRTTAASKMLSNFTPPYDATVVARMKAAGAVVLGKLNSDEFAMGSSGETSFFGPTKNPWNLEFVPGGSSSGSAAAQAAGLCAVAIGTDTGGSIRQPASFCGVVGVKPTYGRVSRHGVIAYASSLDQAGPMARSVADAALLLEVISGSCTWDATTSNREVPKYSQELNSNVKGKKIGVLKEFLTDKLDADVKTAVEQAIQVLENNGAEIVEVSVPLCEFAVPTYYLIAASEASSNLARYDGVRYGYRADFPNLSAVDLEKFYGKTRSEGFGSEVKLRIMLGAYCLSAGYYDAFYNKAAQVRRLITEQYLKAFEKCDVIISPVSTAPAFKINEKISDPIQMYMNDIFTTSTNLAGLPGLSVPFSSSQSGMPIGIQLTARHFDEQQILDIAYALEQESLVKGQKPHVS